MWEFTLGMAENDKELESRETAGVPERFVNLLLILRFQHLLPASGDPDSDLYQAGEFEEQLDWLGLQAQNNLKKLEA